MITGLISARLLGPEGRGVLASIVSVSSVAAAIGSVSIQEGVVFRSSRMSGLARAGVASSGLLLAIVLSVITVIVSWNVIGLILEGGARDLCRLFLINIPLNYFSLVLVAYYQAGDDARFWSILRALPTFTAAAIAVCLLALSLKVEVSSFLIATAIGNVAIIVSAFARLWLRDQGLPRPSLIEAKSILAFGGRLHPAALSANARDHLDRLVMTFLLPAAALGNYAAAATLAAGVMVLGVTIDLLVFPRLASEVDAEAFRSKYELVTRGSFALIVVAVCGVALLSPYIVPFLFGPEYSSAASLTQLLAVAYGFAAMKSVVGLGLKAANHPLKLGMVELCTLVVLAIAMPTFISLMGAPGAAMAAITAQAVSLIAMLWIARQKLSIRLADLIILKPQDVKLSRWRALL